MLLKSPFLTAHWRNLINITYAVNPEWLLPHVPQGVELDIQNGYAFVSFVAFDFVDTRLKGWRIPFHEQFPEINLRYYVRYRTQNSFNNKVVAPEQLIFDTPADVQRGVCFIREYVPKPCIALVANRFYNEPYRAITMHAETVGIAPDAQQVRHRFKVGKTWHTVAVEAETTALVPSANSIEHYFKEHELGFGADKRGNTLYYRVHHPVWAVYPIRRYALQADFGAIYGKQWAALNEQRPFNVLLAQGSEVAVYHPLSLRDNPPAF